MRAVVILRTRISCFKPLACALVVPLVVLPLLLGVTTELRAQTAATFGQVVRLGATPSDLVLDQSRSQLYLVNTAANRIDILSTTTNSITSSIYVGTGPLAAAMSPDNAYLYVTNGVSTSVSVIDLNAGGVVQAVSMPAQPQGVAVGGDGTTLISTLDSTGVNTLVRFDRTQATGNQLTSILTPPPPSTPTPAPSTTLSTPVTKFLSKLATTPDGQYIVGLANPTTTQTYLFVYEVSSASILRSRTVTGQSTVLAISPDGSRFMAGYTLYDIATLSILGQMNNANAPFSFPTTFSTVQNVGGSFFSPDGATLYGAFNVAASTNPPPPANSSTLLVSDPNNLAIKLGIVLPENIVAKMVVTSDGANAWSLSQSGLIYLPMSTLYTHPILAPSSTQVFLTTNPCNPGLAQGTITINNLGAGKLTYAVTTISSALTTSVSTGVAPSTITFTMEPGRLTNVTRQPGTNLVVITGAGAVNLQGQALNVTLASSNAINIPPVIRVYMNYRNSSMRGVVYPVPTTPNNSPTATQITATAATTAGAALVNGDQGLQDIVLDQPRNRVYISNAGYNRVEIFDTVNQVFLTPIPVGQLPGAMAMSTDGNTLYVAGTGGELISIVDLTIGTVTGKVNLPPLPRQAGGLTATLLYPQALAVGLYGLEFVMSNGGQWSVIGGNAVPRPIDSVTTSSTTSNALSVTATTRVNMISSPDNRYILTLAGNNGTAYLYDASADGYVASAFLFTNPIQGFYGPIGAGSSQTYFTLDGLFTNASLTVLPVQTLTRNVTATAPFDSNDFVRFTTPIQTSITATPATVPEPTLELVNISTGSPTLLAMAPENPRFTLFGTTRYNMPGRSMVIDSNNVAYILTVSGLSVVPLTPNGAPTPQIAAKNGIVNASNGSATLQVGGFINVNGTNLASAATASALPTPTVLGGSCVTFNDVALPLLQTSAGQIVAQIPPTVNTGTNVVQVRSLGTAQESNSVVVTVQAPAGTTSTAPSVVDTVNTIRVHPE